MAMRGTVKGAAWLTNVRREMISWVVLVPMSIPTDRMVSSMQHGLL